MSQDEKRLYFVEGRWTQRLKSCRPCGTAFNLCQNLTQERLSVLHMSARELPKPIRSTPFDCASVQDYIALAGGLRLSDFGLKKEPRQGQFDGALRLLDPSYMRSVGHRGGWNSVMKNLHDRGLLRAQGRIVFVDLIEKWFFWSAVNGKPSPPVRAPWIGIVHSSGSLPAHIPAKKGLQGMFQQTNFKESLPSCKGIITLALDQRRWLAPRLADINAVPLYTLRHPISTDIKQFNFTLWQMNADGWKVVLLGSQYRKVASIYMLQSPFPKVWLPGSKQTNNIEAVRDSEFKHSNFAQSSATGQVDVVYTSSNREYDRLLTLNIIIIDVWVTTANNAVLECIASNTPFFVNELQSVKEYVGPAYPLFFTKTSEIEAILTNRPLLLRKFAEGHSYLKAMDKSHLSTERFANDLNLIASMASAESDNIGRSTNASSLKDTPENRGARTSELTSFLLIVCGHGVAERSPILYRSVRSIQTDLEVEGVRFRCLLFVHNLSLLESVKSEFTMCDVRANSGGLWTDHMASVPNAPEEDVIGLLMDDVDTGTVNAASLVRTMQAHGFDVASPSFPKWHYDVMHPRQGCLLHGAEFVDILFTVMSRDAWICWQKHLDLEINRYGWGYDRTFSKLCDVRIAVMDQQVANHVGPECETGGECSRTYDSAKARKQMLAWLVHVHGVTRADAGRSLRPQPLRTECEAGVRTAAGADLE